jgi:hypothetical protein
MIGQLKPATIVLAALVGVACGCGSSGKAATTSPSDAANASVGSAPELAPIHGTYAPKIDPANFVSGVDNRWFPLKPGTKFHYKGVQEDGKTPQTDDALVIRRHKMILGVRCTVVQDSVYQRGKLIERTIDWYAQDKYGNVWYMGELAREVKHGRLVKAGDSWQAGVRGAKAGIIMPGNPQPGDQYRQEYYPGHALDQARVLGPGGKVKVPAGTYKSTLETVETAPKLDPGVAEHKWYVAGVGDIEEHTVSGNREHIKLVSVTRHR